LKDDSIHLLYLSESIDLVKQYLVAPDHALDQDLFLNDRRTQDAVLRRMETLADAASHLSDALKARHRHIPWRRIGDFRNVLAHGYSDIDLDRVWRAIVDDLPGLQAVVAEELGRAKPP
jgi:uncharacterized protein with HEPN domain